MIGCDLNAIGEAREQTGGGFFDGRRQCAKLKRDAGMPERNAQALAHILVKAAQNIIAAQGDRHLRPQARKQRGEFDRDITAADDQETARKGGEVENFVRRYRVFQAGNGGGEFRMRAGRDQYMAGGDFAARGQLDAIGIEHMSAFFDERDAGGGEIFAINCGEARDLGLLGAHKAGPIKMRGPDTPAKAGGIGEIIGEAAGVDEYFFGHAAANNAGSADAKFFGDHTFGAMLGGDARRPHAA